MTRSSRWIAGGLILVLVAGGLVWGALLRSSLCDVLSSASQHSALSTSFTIPAISAPSAKKGVGTWGFDGVQKVLTEARLPWYYTWGPHGFDDVPGFVPMIWGADDAAQISLTDGGDTVLGFNEPDLADQADLTVDQAVALWPSLEATGRRLGSPAVASGADTPGGWLDQFLSRASVDFVALHWYSADFTDPIGATRSLCDYLVTVHDRYGKPLWLTEYALADFTQGVAAARYPTGAEQAAFVDASVAMLERLPFVERYAWFALCDTGNVYRTGLYASPSRKTAAGVAYLGTGG
jgi:hypothetical protein